MQLEREFAVPASFEETWLFLLDPGRVAPCLPGATLDSVGGKVLAGRWRIRFGPVTVTYRGTARLVEEDARTGTLVLEASGKEARGEGTAQAVVRIQVAAGSPNGSTRVTVRIDLEVTGRAGGFEPEVARVAKRIVDRFALSTTESIGAARTAGAPPELVSRSEPVSRPELVSRPEPVVWMPPVDDGDELGPLAPLRGRPGRWGVVLGVVLVALGLLYRRRQRTRRG